MERGEKDDAGGVMEHQRTKFSFIKKLSFSLYNFSFIEQEKSEIE